MDEDYLDLGDLGKAGDVRKRKRSNRESRNQEVRESENNEVGELVLY